MKRIKKHLHSTFIGHEGNNYKPHLLHHKSLSFLALIAILAKFGVFLLLVFFPGYALPIDITFQNVINLTNQQRVDTGIPQLRLNNLLTQAAQAKAQDMLANQYFAHYSPSNISPWNWFNKAGYAYAYAGENLAMDFVTAESLVQAWMASESHRKNILNGKYEEVGIGILEGNFKGAKTILVVQMFGAPTPTKTIATTTTAEEVAEENPPQEEVTQEVQEEQKLPEVEPEKTVVIPSLVEPDTYDVKVTVKEEPSEEPIEEPKEEPVIEEPTKVAIQLGDNTKELTKVEDDYVGSIKEDNDTPRENVTLLVEDSKKNVVSVPLINTNYFKTSILRPDKFLSSERLVQIIFYSRNFLLTLLIFLSLTLILNILIKVRVQHKPTVVYTLLLLYMLGVLIIM